MNPPRKFLLLFVFILYCALGLNVISSFAENDVNGPSEVEKGTHSINAVKETGEVSKTEPINVDVTDNETVRILSIDECIEIAIRNYLPLKTTRKSIKLAQWRIWEARRNLLPKVGIQWQEYSGKIYGRHFTGRKQSVDLQQTLFHGGEFVYTMMQAQTNLKIVEREYARLKNDLILQVKKGYYTLAKAKENMRLQRELSQEVSRIHEMVTREFEGGLAANLELLNVTSQANQVKFQLTSAKGDVEVAELILKQAMSVGIKEKMDINEVLEFKKVELDFDEVLRDALIHRPEMQINSLMISYYMYEIRIARSKSWPKIDAMGSFGLAKEEFIAKDSRGEEDPVTGADPDQKLEQQWYAGIKCSVPLWGSTTEYSYTKEVWVPVVSTLRGTETITNAVKFNFLDNLAQYSDKYSAEVDLDRAKQELIKTKQDVTLEVKENCFNYEKALMQLDTAANKVRYQEGDLELTKFRRQMDEIQDSNVVDSMIKLAQEKFGYTQAISDCNIALASISKAVGVADYFKDQELNGNNKNNNNK